MSSRPIPTLTTDEVARFHRKIQRGPGCRLWTGEITEDERAEGRRAWLRRTADERQKGAA